MNLAKIKRKYPKAFKALMEWVKSPIMGNIWNLEYYVLKNPEGYLGNGLRRLYDFFDSHSIHIDTLWDGINRYHCYVSKAGHTIDIGVKKTRTKAESKGFKLAFKILNERL